MVTAGTPQQFRGDQWIPIWNDPGLPTLWIYYGDEMSPDEKLACREFANKVVELINQTPIRLSDVASLQPERC